MLSGDDLLLHASWLCLLGAVVVPKRESARAFIALAAAALLARSLFWNGSTADALWAGTVILVSILLLARRFDEGRRVRFDAQEQAMLKTFLRGLPRSKARHLIDQGLWLRGAAGEVLTRENQPVENLYYLAEGEAAASINGREVGRLTAGDLVGELCAFSGETASATVVLSQPARMWCAPVARLKPYVDAHEDIRNVIDRGFAAALTTKLRSANRTIAADQEAVSG